MRCAGEARKDEGGRGGLSESVEWLGGERGAVGVAGAEERRGR